MWAYPGLPLGTFPGSPPQSGLVEGYEAAVASDAGTGVHGRILQLRSAEQVQPGRLHSWT